MMNDCFHTLMQSSTDGVKYMFRAYQCRAAHQTRVNTIRGLDYRLSSSSFDKIKRQLEDQGAHRLQGLQ